MRNASAFHFKSEIAMRVLTTSECEIVSGGLRPIEIDQLDGGAYSAQLAAATQDLPRTAVDIDNNGTADGFGTVHNGVLIMDDGTTFDSWTLRGEVTSDHVLGDNHVNGGAWDQAVLTFQNGEFFTGIGKLIGDSPQIFGNVLDEVIRDIWDQAAQEVIDTYSQYYELHYDPATGGAEGGGENYDYDDQWWENAGADGGTNKDNDYDLPATGG
jgi:hypothetical protein